MSEPFEICEPCGRIKKMPADDIGFTEEDHKNLECEKTIHEYAGLWQACCSIIKTLKAEIEMLRSNKCWFCRIKSKNREYMDPEGY